MIFLKSQDNTFEKAIIPIAAPAMKTSRTNMSRFPTASRINLYIPSNTRMKLPEMPGKIMAQMAIDPDRKMNHHVVLASAGEITVMK
jgi:hypothetical protein